jgi:hypothetical protein
MRVAVAFDHRGVKLRGRVLSELEALGHEAVDLGTDSAERRIDYPDKAREVGDAIRGGEAERGVLVCGSGVGAAIAESAAREDPLRKRVAAIPKNLRWLVNWHIDMIRLKMADVPPRLRDPLRLERALAWVLPVAVVTLDHQGAAEMVDDASGFKIPAASPMEVVSGIATCIAHFQDDPELIRHKGDAARARVRSTFTWDRKAEVLRNAYLQAIEPTAITEIALAGGPDG